MSLEKKISLGMFAVLGGTGCTEGNISASLGGVTIYEAKTDSDGKAYFTEEESGEEVEVTLEPPVPDATILYFDNFLSEGFLISHPAFSPQLNIALHNSDHQYSLSLTPAVIPHQGLEKEQSKGGAETYLSWGIGENKFDEGVQYIEDNLPESAVAEVYSFIPYQHGFSASTSTISALDVKFSGGCSYGNEGNGQSGNDYGSGNTGSGGSNNSDQNPPGECAGMLFCDEFNGTALNTSKWNTINDSGIGVYGGWLSLPNASSIAAQNGFGNSCADKRVDLRTSAYGSSVFLGNMGLSAGNTTGILSCGGEDAIVNIAGAENGLSLYKSGGLLSLLVNGQVTSVPCSENISYVQLTAGLNDKVDVDYVRVKCN